MLQFSRIYFIVASIFLLEGQVYSAYRVFNDLTGQFYSTLAADGKIMTTLMQNIRLLRSIDSCPAAEELSELLEDFTKFTRDRMSYETEFPLLEGYTKVNLIPVYERMLKVLRKDQRAVEQSNALFHKVIFNIIGAKCDKDKLEAVQNLLKPYIEEYHLTNAVYHGALHYLQELTTPNSISGNNPKQVVWFLTSVVKHIEKCSSNLEIIINKLKTV